MLLYMYIVYKNNNNKQRNNNNLFNSDEQFSIIYNAADRVNGGGRHFVIFWNIIINIVPIGILMLDLSGGASQKRNV